jgi:hypothetical protein
MYASARESAVCTPLGGLDLTVERYEVDRWFPHHVPANVAVRVHNLPRVLDNRGEK